MTEVSGKRKCRSEQRTASEAVERSEPSCERIWTVVESDQTDLPATRHRDSVLRAEERRRASSRMREMCEEGSVLLCEPFSMRRELGREPENGTDNVCGRVWIKERFYYRPGSKAGEAMDENSQLMVKIPSNLRSG